MNPKKIDQIGCIDIGSNAIKYKQFRIIAGDNQNYSKELETYKRIPIRLGTDAFRKGKIRKKTINKLTESLDELVSNLDSKKINLIGGFATSAMRSASNGSEVCQHLNTKLNLNIHLLSGDQEAQLLNDLSNSFPADGSYLFVDVGGGSTELFYKNSSNVMFKSLNLGAVRIYLEKDHLSEWQDLEAFLASLGHIKNIVGVGGNVRSLISIINDDINNSVSKKSLNACLLSLVKLSKKEKIENYDFSSDRADIIESAGKIFLRIMDILDKASLRAAPWSICDALVQKYVNENYANSGVNDFSSSEEA